MTLPKATNLIGHDIFIVCLVFIISGFPILQGINYGMRSCFVQNDVQMVNL